MDIYEKAKSELNFYTKLLCKLKYSHLNEKDCQISYIPSIKSGDWWFALQSGLMAQFKMQEKNISEKKVIRKNSKNYLKIYKLNNIVKRIDKINNGKIDVVYMTYFEKDTIIYKPFSSDGGFYPTYSCITEFIDDEVSCEYMIEGEQIVLEIYEKEKKNKWNYTNLNYVPSGEYPVLGLEKGVFKINKKITYVTTYSEYWYEKLKE